MGILRARRSLSIYRLLTNSNPFQLSRISLPHSDCGSSSSYRVPLSIIQRRLPNTSISRKFSHTQSGSEQQNIASLIGLELHVQLDSQSKLFSSALAPAPNQEANTNIDFFDAAIPGVQPILSVDCLRLALVASLALGCKINQKTSFDRKHYFYPDLPSEPIATDGKLQLTPDDGIDRILQVRIKQIQLEQDTAKSYIDPLSSKHTLIDLNRSGAALIEIVTEPDLRTAKEASAFVRKLQTILRYAGVSKVNMEQGSLRCDVNVSVSLPEKNLRGERCEIKNVNGFSHIEHAINFECTRQWDVLVQGGRIETETRGFNVAKRSTFKLRDKETGEDYRYLPDPDLPRLTIPESVIENLKKLTPELPNDLIKRLHTQYDLTRTSCEILIMIGCDNLTKLIEVGCGVRYFESIMNLYSTRISGKSVSDWIIHELLGQLSKSGLRFIECNIHPKDFGRLVCLNVEGVLPRTIARQMIYKSLKNPSKQLNTILEEYLNQRKPQNLRTERSQTDNQIDGKKQDQALKIAKDIIKEMPKEVKLITEGNHKIIGKLIGLGLIKQKKMKLNNNDDVDDVGVEAKELGEVLCQLLGVEKTDTKNKMK